MKRFIPLSLTAAVFLVAAVVVLIPDGDVVRTDVRTAAEASVTSQNGYVVYLDRATGKVTDSRTDAAPLLFDSELANNLSTSSQGLEEVPSPVTGGGVMVDLGGRFQNAMIVVTGENSEVNATCVSHPEYTDSSENSCDRGKE
jgi:hypothetical protein